ncbi:MAG: hypothetical protein U0Y68_15570 [Blastocatellia bacterium]
MNRKITLLDDDDYDLNDDVEPETDFNRWQVVRRGKKTEAHTVTLAPDVAAVFPTSEAVNEALRQIIREKKAA